MTPIAPKCPITGCPGTFVTKTSKRGRRYRQCDTCGAFDGARYLTAAEKAQQKRDKAAKRSRKTKAQIREEMRREARRLELETPQLPGEGWSISDWFPGYEDEWRQGELFGSVQQTAHPEITKC